MRQNALLFERKLETGAAGSGSAATGVGIANGSSPTQMNMSDATAKSTAVATDGSGVANFKFIANIMNDGGTVAAGDAYSSASASIVINYQ